VIWILGAIACLALAFIARDGLRNLVRRAFGGSTTLASRAETAAAISAQHLLADCARLSRAGASWAEIGASMNPDNDSHVAALLNRIHAVHMGVTADTLGAIEQGCRIALAENAAASGFDALSEASRRSQLVSSAKL
jgi:hypothetical protein